ncbi:MAG: S8/S53 family peptidase [Ferruginibacter sp.]
MKKLTAFVLAAAIAVSSCKKAAFKETSPQEELMSTEQIDAFIKQQFELNKRFEWKTASDVMIWSAVQQSDKVMAIGYKPASEGNIDTRIHQVNINDAAWKSVKETLLNKILASEQKLDKTITLQQLIQWEEDVLPVINVNVRSLETVKMLRANNLVRYAEPMGYQPQDVVRAAQQENAGNSAVLSSSGCGSNTGQTGLVAGSDYSTIAPNTKQSWNYTYHGIPGAWAKSTGAGVKVFIIDTGCEYDQENLGTAFNQGSSSGRTIEKTVTLPRPTIFGIPYGSAETPDDGCGHGTSMAGACAAPRGTDGAACGIAYNCNLVTCRAAEDVLLDASREVKGVATAYTNAANRADVKIISMSMGTITSSSQITDAINYAYGKGKLMFCAAGTSFSWTAGWYGVIFPAWLSNVNAVTGVKEGNFNDNCDACHDGAETDFTVVMEKASNGRHALSLAMSGDVPSTVGGSSVATASMSGMAALVWSRFPAYTRDQVLSKLVVSSSNYPTRNGSLGWGNVNVNTATN